MLYFFLFRLPSLFKEFPEEQVIVFEVLPVSEKSNVITHKNEEKSLVQNEDAKKTVQSNPEVAKQESESPDSKQLVKENKKREAKIAPPKNTPVLPVPEEKKVVKQKEESPKIRDENQKHEMQESVAQKKQDVKQKKISTTPKKTEKKKQRDSDLDSLLKNLEQSSDGDNFKSNKLKRNKQSDNKKESRGVYNENLPISVSEAALIKRQIERNWSNIPAGARNNPKVRIMINIKLDKDANVESVNVVEKVCLNIEYGVCDALADSAMRAIWQASPIENLDPARFNYWREININFDPSKL